MARPVPSICSHDQPEARLPHPVQDAVRHRRRHRLAGARHRRQRRDLLAVQPDAAPAAAGPGAGSAGQPRRRPGPSRARRRAATPAAATTSSATRCSATSSARRPSFTGIAAHRPVRRQPRLRGTDAQRRGRCSSRAAISRCSACSRRSAGCSGPQDDQAVGESHVVVLSHAYWQTRFGAQSHRARPDDDRQRPDADHRRRRAARASTGRRSASKPEVFVPITLRGLMQPGFKGFDDRKSYWAYLFARLKPGRDDRAGARGHQRPVSRHHQRRRGAAAER